MKEPSFVLIRAALLFAGGLSVIYALFLMLLIRFNGGQALCLILGFPLIFCGLFYRRIELFWRTRAGAVLLLCMRVGYALAGLTVLVCCVAMYVSASQTPESGADAVIVLGAGLRGEEVSLTLRNRLDAAYDYLEENPATLCVLSGGKGGDERISEAEAMYRYMLGRGLEPKRIIKEEVSVNTAQNIAFSRQILTAVLGEDINVIIATSDFHVFRGVMLARGAGFSDVGGIAAPSEMYLLPQYCLREVCGIFKDFIMGGFG